MNQRETLEQALAALVNLSAFLGIQGNFQDALEYARRGKASAEKFPSYPWIAWALTYQGHAQFGLQNAQEAEKAYQEACKLRRELGQPALETEALAGLARIALAAGDLPTTLGYVEQIMAILDQGINLDGTDEPLRVLLTCVQALRAAGDGCSQALLEIAQQKLQELARSAPDEAARKMLVENVPWHAELAALAMG